METYKWQPQDFATPPYDDGMRRSSGVTPANMDPNYYQNPIYLSVPTAAGPSMAPPTILQVPLSDAQMMMYSPQHPQQLGQGGYLNVMPIGYPQIQYPQHGVAYGSPPGPGGVGILGPGPEQLFMGLQPQEVQAHPKQHHVGYRGTNQGGRGRSRGGSLNTGNWGRGRNQRRGGNSNYMQQEPMAYYQNGYVPEVGVYQPQPVQDLGMIKAGSPVVVMQTQYGFLHLYDQNVPTTAPQTEFAEGVSGGAEVMEHQSEFGVGVPQPQQHLGDIGQQQNVSIFLEHFIKSANENPTPSAPVEVLYTAETAATENKSESEVDINNMGDNGDSPEAEPVIDQATDAVVAVNQLLPDSTTDMEIIELTSAEKESSEAIQETSAIIQSETDCPQVDIPDASRPSSPKELVTEENIVKRRIASNPNPPKTEVIKKIAPPTGKVAEIASAFENSSVRNNQRPTKDKDAYVSRIYGPDGRGVTFVNSKFKDARGGIVNSNRESKSLGGKMSPRDSRDKPAPIAVAATINRRDVEGGGRKPGNNTGWKPSVPKLDQSPVKSVGVNNGSRNVRNVPNRTGGTTAKLPTNVSNDPSAKIKSGGSSKTEEYPELASNRMKRNASSVNSHCPTTTSSVNSHGPPTTFSAPTVSTATTSPPENRSWARIVSQGASDDNGTNSKQSSRSNGTTEMADKASGDSAVPGLEQWKHNNGLGAVKPIGTEEQKL